MSRLSTCCDMPSTCIPCPSSDLQKSCASQSVQSVAHEAFQPNGAVPELHNDLELVLSATAHGNVKAATELSHGHTG